MLKGNLGSAGGVGRTVREETGLSPRKRKGFSLVELLVALPVVLMLSAAALDVMSACLKSFEKDAFFAAHPGWQSTERLFAFIDVHVRHCGLGLPPSWGSSLFSDAAALNAMPAWAAWGGPIDVGESVEGRGFRSTGDAPGGTLRLVSAVPSGAVLVRPFAAEAGERARAFFSDAVKSEANVRPLSSASWLLVPGWEVPLRLAGDANTSAPLVEVRQDADLPVGAVVCRLAALAVWCVNGVVFADFYDESGDQPLFRHIDEVSFRLDTDRRLLTVRAAFGADAGARMELERSWHVVR